MNGIPAARTDAIWRLLYRTALADPKFGPLATRAEKNGHHQWEWMIGQWAEAIFMAVRHHKTDAVAIAREFRLAYENSFARRVWTDKTVEARREIYAGWVRLVQAGLDEAEAAA